MIEKDAEYDAHALPTIDQTESVEYLYEENEDSSWQSSGQVDKDSEKEARHDFEQNFKQCILEEEGFDGVYPIVVFAMKYLSTSIDACKRKWFLRCAHIGTELRSGASRQNTILPRLNLVNGGPPRGSWISLTHLLLNEAESALNILVIRFPRCPKQGDDDDGEPKHLGNPSIDDHRTASIIQGVPS